VIDIKNSDVLTEQL